MGQFKERRNRERKDRRRAHELSRRLDAGEKLGQRGSLITHWYHLWGTLVPKFEPGLLQEFVREGINKAGSLRKLREKTNWDQKSIAAVRDGRNTITVEKLKSLLTFLDKSYDSVENKIIEIGGKRHRPLRNPKLPFNLKSVAGADVIAAGMGDGCVNQQHRHFQYIKIKYNPEHVKEVIKSVRQVFGDIRPSILRDEKGKKKGIEFHSAAIGIALERAGVMVGNKTMQVCHAPDVILSAERKMKISYMSRTAKDEGNADLYRTTYSRATTLERLLSNKHKETLKALDWEVKRLPSGYIEHYVTMTKDTRAELGSDLSNLLYESSKPPILEEERHILNELFGFEAKLEPSQIYWTKKKGYRVSWRIQVSGKENCTRLIRGLNLKTERRPTE